MFKPISPGKARLKALDAVRDALNAAGIKHLTTISEPAIEVGKLSPAYLLISSSEWDGASAHTVTVSITLVAGGPTQLANGFDAIHTALGRSSVVFDLDSYESEPGTTDVMSGTEDYIVTVQ